MEFQLHHRQFRVKKLSAFEQLHLSRKIAPLLPPLAPLIIKMTEEAKKEDDGAKREPFSISVLTFAKLAGPFADALASMKDQDAEQVFTMTLSSVEIQTDEARNVWIPLWIAGAKMASDKDLNDAAMLLPIVVKVIVHNLGNFIDGILTSHEEEGIPVPSGVASPVKKTG